MATKPTYEELAQKIRKLELEVMENKEIERTRKKSEERHRALFEYMSDGVGGIER